MDELIAKLALKYRTTLILLGMGLFVGVLGALLGVGGAALIVPGLMFFLGFSQQRAHGTSLITALLLSGAAVAIYSTHGQMNWLVAAETAGGCVAGAAIGSGIARVIKTRNSRQVLGFFVAAVGIVMLVAGLRTIHISPPAAPALFTAPDPASALIVIGTGFLAGLVSAILGVGAGLMMVPAIVLILGAPQKLAQGISLAAMLPTAFLGLIMHGAVGNVDFRVGKWVGLGAAAGALIGSLLALYFGSFILKISFGGYLLINAVLMIMRRSRA